MNKCLKLPLILALFPFTAGFTSPSIEIEDLAESYREIAGDPNFKLMRNALSQNPLQSIVKNWDCVCNDHFYFSHEVSSTLPITDQQRSGRCWMFAGLNCLRLHFVKKLNLGDVEFSESYLFFFDKLEKANFFLEQILSTRDKGLQSKQIQELLAAPLFDGSTWNNFVGLVKKYGLMPKSAFPESDCCRDSSGLNTVLNQFLRKNACHLRTLAEGGTDLDTLRKEKSAILQKIFRILALHFGLPPKYFNWRTVDKNENILSYKAITPKEFAENVVAFPFDEYAALMHCPREAIPYYKNYIIKNSSFIVGGPLFEILNLPMKEMKKAVVKTIKNNFSVWFGADIRKQFDPLLGILDPSLYDLNSLYQIDLTLPKSKALDYKSTQPCHAMTLIGVHLEDKKPVQWKVENSWGGEVGKGGFFRMTDHWFDEYVIEVVVPKDSLTDEQKNLLGQPPIELDNWEDLYARPAE